MFFEIWECIVKTLECILCCFEEDHHERSYHNSNHTNYDPLLRPDPNRLYYYEHYPNESISRLTVQNSSSVSRQLGHGKSTDQVVSQSLKSSKPSPNTAFSPRSPQPLQKLNLGPSNPSVSSSSQFLPVSSSQTSSSKSSLPPPKAPQYVTQTSLFTNPASGSSKPILSPSGPAPSNVSTPSSVSAKPAILSKPTLSPLPTDSTNKQKKASFILVQKSTSNYMIPKSIEDLIKKDIVPEVLKKPVSPSTYKDYFAALLYAEDFYEEKWSGFQLSNVTMELREAAIYNKSDKHLKISDQKDDKFFVVFRLDCIPERRPFLLSRDFVYAQRTGGKSKKFQGLLYRVVKSTTVLVEFERDFHSQHQPNHKYDISFSFNRVPLKRAHEAIASASDPLFRNYIFPDCASRERIPFSSSCLYSGSAVRKILSFEGGPPYLVEGSDSDDFVVSAVLKIFQRSPKSRILICTPRNTKCDRLMESLMKVIPEPEMFRANAAFREVIEVPEDILQVSLFKKGCFSCPSLLELRQYKVISSTFVSSFRLHSEGIAAGHFSHIFLVDASSAIEPEIMIVLGNLATENTSVIVTGAAHDRPIRVRSDIARRNGLKISYFERLSGNKTYRRCNPMFFTKL